MAYHLTTATDLADLLGELELFVEAQGWTVTWNTGSQIGINNGSCFWAFGNEQAGTATSAVTDSYPDPDVVYQDMRCAATLAKNFTGHGSRYWGPTLTGSPVTGQYDGDRVKVNDILGPFTEVHFFGNDKYIWCVLRHDGDRYTHFGFGALDKRGMTHPDCHFAIGHYWEWWRNDFDGGSGRRYKESLAGLNAYMLRMGNDGACMYHIPDGVLDPAFGFTDDKIESYDRAVWGYNAWTEPQRNADSATNTGLMDHAWFKRNKPVTGGIPLLTVPLLARSDLTSTALLTFIGDLPAIRLCDVSNIGIAEEISYGSDTYLAFPLKRRTSVDAAYDGTPTSYGFGIAIKKD